MGKTFFTKCFACFCGHECGKTPRLPRKKKKQLKNFRIVFDKYCLGFFMDNPTSCNIVEEYNHYKKLFHLLPFLKKFNKEIDLVRSFGPDFGIEPVYINEKGRLCWYWETDDDYTGGSSGLMPFCYNKEEAEDTWAFSEVKNIIKAILDYPDDFVFPEQIKSDKDLLEFVKRKIS